MTSDPLRRLTAGLAEDERIARAIDDKQVDSGWSVSYNPYGLANTPPGWYITPHIGLAYESEGAEHIARHDPHREFAEVALKRLILERHRPRELDDYECDPETGESVEIVVDYCVECSTMLGNGIDDVRWPCRYIAALQAIYPEDTDKEAQ